MAEITKNGHRWRPGESGNPAGRPLGSRHKISEAIIRDISDAWEKHGASALDRLALTEPAKFAQLAAGLLPRDVMLTIGARTPGNLEPEDWNIAVGVFQAIKDVLPDASKRPPGEILEFVSDAIRAQTAKVIENGA